MEYGTGAIMSVPAHDQRDFDFAKTYDLPVKVVIVPEGNTPLFPLVKEGAERRWKRHMKMRAFWLTQDSLPA